ncbi:MAG: polyisoprenoid-binding protein [Candidatus Omnitrophica bacterium]|nr:polyisoprenoid-binding protein [Candidatus Omnitrophota bacterium]
MIRKTLFVLFILAFFGVHPVWAVTYKLDTTHTTVGFKIRHLFSWVQGTFNEFEGTFDYDPEHPETWKTEAAIQAASIDTRVEQRDKHLRSADFFAVETYPTITFKSTQITDATAEVAKVNGLLSIHGVEKPVVLDLQIHGVGKDPWGNTRAGFTASVKINRKDFGLNWNELLETGQVLVGEEVFITIEVEGLLQ